MYKTFGFDNILLKVTVSKNHPEIFSCFLCLSLTNFYDQKKLLCIIIIIIFIYLFFWCCWFEVEIVYCLY